MFTQNGSQNVQPTDQQLTTDGQTQNPVNTQDQIEDQVQASDAQPEASTQDNYVDNYQPPQGDDLQQEAQSVQEPLQPADDQSSDFSAGVTIEPPPESGQLQEDSTQIDQSTAQVSETPVATQAVVQEQPDLEEGFLPPQQTPPNESTDVSEETGAVSATENQDQDDSISEKLDELEALVEEFEQKKKPEGGLTLEEGGVNDQQPIVPPQESPTTMPPVVNYQEDKEDQMDDLNMDEKIQVGGDQSATVTPPPVDTSQSSPEAVQSDQVTQSETLADQNIFFLLGAEESSVDEQEQFLDELQQVIWEDFLEKDLELLITSQEKEKTDQILQDQSLDELQKQEQLLQYLDGFIPDLEEIMMDKALQLKKELVLERVASLKESSAQDAQKMSQLEEVEQLINQDRWYSAGIKLNQLG